MGLTGKYKITERKEGEFIISYQYRFLIFTWWQRRYDSPCTKCPIRAVCPGSNLDYHRYPSEAKEVALRYIKENMKLRNPRTFIFDVNNDTRGSV